MKNVYIVIILLSVFITGKAQNAYYDALTLSKYVAANALKKDSLSQTEVVPILKNYITTGTKGVLLQTDANNSFLSYQANNLIAARTSAAGIFSGIGNMDVTALADGLAQFLVERSNEELNVAFFQRFENFLASYPEIKLLFPNTSALLKNFKYWEYANLLNTLRESFDKDLKELLQHTVALKDLKDGDCGNNTKCKERIDILRQFFQKDEGRYLMAALKIADGSVNGSKVPDIIHAVAGPDMLGGLTHPAQQDLKTIYRFTDILSYSLRSNENNRHYISEKQLKDMFNDATRRDIFFGLLYEQVKNEHLTLAGYDLADDVLKPIATGAAVGGKAYEFLDSLIVKAERFHADVTEVQRAQKGDKKDLPAKLGNMFVDFQDLLNHSVNVSLIDERLSLPPVVNDVTTIVNSTLTIAHDLAVRNYNAAVFGLLNTIQKTADVICKNNPGACQSAPVAFLSNFVKYGSFAANVVTAKDPDDVKKAIKAVALPSGSSAVKKHSWFNISIQAYVGLTSGRNYYFKDTSTVVSYRQTGLDTPTNTILFASDTQSVANPKSTPIAIHAPVGFAFSWGLAPRKRHPGSISLFVPVIDLGALVGFRLNDKADENNNYRKIVSDNIKIRLSNIFAPGAGLTIGLPDVPISVMGYWQWIPTLQRDNTTNNLQFYDKTGYRAGASILVDLPIFNLFTTKMDSPKVYKYEKTEAKALDRLDRKAQGF